MAFEILDAHLFTKHSGDIAKKTKAFIEKQLANRPLMTSFAIEPTWSLARHRLGLS
jgi:hypothetical protein